VVCKLDKNDFAWGLANSTDLPSGQKESKAEEPTYLPTNIGNGKLTEHSSTGNIGLEIF
jgi:hypothetical protein